jgi:hypothetical protein
MRLATVFTGAAAVTAGFAPTALANTAVRQPFRLAVYVEDSPHPASWVWTCTP